MKQRIANELSSSPALTLKDLKVNGKDISLITENGPLTGKVLKELLDMVIEKPSLNERETLLYKAKEISKRLKE